MAEYRYFSKETDPWLFKCPETGEEGVLPSFVSRLDELRHRCGFPFVISSGYRSPRHPIESAKPSPGMHTRGIAADIVVHSATKRGIIMKNALDLGFTGVGVYKTHMHVDVRPGDLKIWAG